MRKAIVYAYPLIPRMRHYLYDGRIFINNNRAEGVLRPMALARKNMLFCGNQQAAENTAVICSLLGSCREYGVDLCEWLNDVTDKLPYYLTPKSERKPTELLSDRWGGYWQSHSTLPTVTGMSMDNPGTVHRQAVHATWNSDELISLTTAHIHNLSGVISLGKNQAHKMYLFNRSRSSMCPWKKLSEIIQRCVITVAEKLAGAFFVLVWEVRLGGSTWDTQAIQVVVGWMQAVADFTQWHVVDELAEYHAHRWLKGRLERLSPSTVL